MKNRGCLFVAILLAGAAVSLPAAAAFKCTTKNGVTYQDKPCQDADQNLVFVSARDDRARLDDRALQRVKLTEPPTQDRARMTLDLRKADELTEYQEWLERAQKKADSLRACLTREVTCNATALRVNALYLSETQLEGALGSPDDRQLLGMERRSQWTVRVNDSGRLQNVRLVAAWGLCSDDKNYFATGHGHRACRISVE